MPAEVLVMCRECGRPQPAGTDLCEECGSKLPKPLMASSTQQALRESPYVFFEGELPEQRRVLLSARHLELRGVTREPTRLSIDLLNIRSARLVVRPVWESLLFVLGAAAAFPFVTHWAPRVMLGVLSCIAIAAGLLQRRWALKLQLQDGRTLNVVLGVGRPKTRQANQIHNVWGSLSQELPRLGVTVEQYPLEEERS